MSVCKKALEIIPGSIYNYKDASIINILEVKLILNQTIVLCGHFSLDKVFCID